MWAWIHMNMYEMWKQQCLNKDVCCYVIGCGRAFPVFFTIHSCCHLANMTQQLTYMHVKKEPEKFSLFQYLHLKTYSSNATALCITLAWKKKWVDAFSSSLCVLTDCKPPMCVLSPIVSDCVHIQACLGVERCYWCERRGDGEQSCSDAVRNNCA